MNKAVMCVMAFGVLIGGVDRIFKNRLGFGKRFEEGFLYIGPTALSMVGIICLAPLISSALIWIAEPIYSWFGIDPGMCGSVFAIDMGGYQLAMGLCKDLAIGRFSGIVVAAILGCTVVFTIPVGMGIIKVEDHPFFAKGIMVGLITMPVALVIGGFLSGLNILQVLHQNMFVFILALIFTLGLWKLPSTMVKFFSLLAATLKIVTTVGLSAAAIRYMLNIEIIPNMTPLEDAMAVAASIGVMMLGSLPVAEMLQRLLKKPFAWLGGKLEINETSVTGILMSMVSVIPTLTMLKDMDNRGKVLNIAFMVSGSAVLAAHLGFTAAAEPNMVVPMILSKLCGGIAGVLVVLVITAKRHAVG